VTRLRIRSRAAATAVCGLLASVPAALGDVVTLAPGKDNTLYQSTTGSLSNGAGQHFFVGRADAIAAGAIHRGVIAFDVAASIPSGAVITRVDLTLNMSRTIALLQPVSLHRLLADWGEGTSDAPLEEGGGTAATTGDATWIHRFFNTTSLWTGAGAAGDFATAPSTTVQVGAIGAYTFLSTAGMVADAQGWLDNPGSNFGWILIGNESSISTAKRFDSRNNPLASVRPVLTVEFSTGQTGAGRVPDGDRVPGTPLTVEHAAGGDIRLSWGGSCVASDSDFEIYAGDMSNFTVYGPKFCSTAGATTLTFTPAAANEFYLVVPRNVTREGSYGADSTGGQRPPASPACLPQAVAGCP
jgi:hypothetical protein